VTFQGSGLKSIEIAEGVVFIDDSAFASVSVVRDDSRQLKG
jgi:hypothetical protein